ncbi:hypothetical protein IAU60_001396 [Kwoniella sp. DSM 27419]
MAVIPATMPLVDHQCPGNQSTDFGTAQAPDADQSEDDLYPLPVSKNHPPRALLAHEIARVDRLSQLQFFLATAPTQWPDPLVTPSADPLKFILPDGESVSCVLWNGLFHISGTDIAFGRPVSSAKKWEEGVFSDLRNLKPGVDATLEDPKSPLLDHLFRNGCIRTQKKQKVSNAGHLTTGAETPSIHKVFFWFSVPHDRLFLDALERDLKREKAGLEPTTSVVGEPARSFRYDHRRSLYEQFAGKNPSVTSSTPLVESKSLAHKLDFSFLPSSASHVPSSKSITPGPSDHQSIAVDHHAYRVSVVPGSSSYKRRRTKTSPARHRSVHPGGYRSELVRGSEPLRAYSPGLAQNFAADEGPNQRNIDEPAIPNCDPVLQDNDDPRTFTCRQLDCAPYIPGVGLNTQSPKSMPALY